MLKIEIIKFEAQDVITASTPQPFDELCTCTHACFDDTKQFKGHDSTCGCDPETTNHIHPALRN